MSGTLKVTTLQDGASATANMTFDTSGNTTAGGTLAMASSFKRNRIINGNMLIDQRNAGASVTIADSAFIVDRLGYFSTQASKFTAGQNLNSVTPPTGFSSYAGLQTLSAVSVGSSDYFFIAQNIEGLNVADLGWGTANAQTVTLSFKVYSSLTGTFGAVIKNNAANRSYPFTYTISSANTWTTISVTIAGDTTGTWLTTNGVGLRVQFGLGVGSTYNGTAGAWAAGNYISATGATSVVGTNGATFYLTGVQLEVGTKATPYEMQIYSDQLAQCKRYFHKVTNPSTYVYLGNGRTVNSTYGDVLFTLPVTMRAQPTLAYSDVTHFQCAWSSTCNLLSLSGNQSGVSVDTVLLSVGPGTSNSTSVQILQFNNGSTSAYINFSAEL